MEVTYYIQEILIASIITLNIFIVLLFLFRNNKVNTTNKFISIILVFFLVHTFLTILFAKGYLINFPHLLLIGHLVSRLGVPFLFLTLVYELNKRNFRLFDIVHFVPAFLFLLNYAQIYLKPADYKIELIKRMQNEGFDIIWSEASFLSDEYAFLVRVLPFIIYFIAVVTLLFSNNNLPKISPILKQFFILVGFFLLFNLIALPLIYIFPIIDKDSFYEVSMIRYVGHLLFLASFFLLPNFLYYPYFSESLSQVDVDEKELLVLDKNTRRLKQIEQHLNLHKTFLDPDYSISQLEAETNISKRTIGKMIKSAKNQNFNQFLSEFRINYLLHQMPLEEVADKPFHELSYSIGFNSINNFYAHFKRYVGCTPRAYFEKLQINKKD